jgi:hypothetical protein
MARVCLIHFDITLGITFGTVLLAMTTDDTSTGIDDEYSAIVFSMDFKS